MPYHLMISNSNYGGTSISPFPKPVIGCVLASEDGRILGQGRSDHSQHAILHCLEHAGLSIVPLSEWVVSWPSSPRLRQDLKTATLYVTVEPSNERRGEVQPPITELISQLGLARVVLGCSNPIYATEGAAALHKAGLQVYLGVEEEACKNLIEDYTSLATTKLQKYARKHFERTGQVSAEQKVVFLWLTLVCVSHRLICVWSRLAASWFIALLSR